MSSPLVGFAASLPWDRSERTVQFASVFTKVDGQPHDQVRRGLPPHARLPPADAGQRRAARTVPVQGAADGDPEPMPRRRPVSPTRFASFLLDVAVARAARSEGHRSRRPLLGVLHLHPGQVGGDAEADRSISVCATSTTRRSSAWSIKGGLSNYDPATNTLQVAGYGDVGESVGVQRYLKNFGPRAGASYRLNDKTVLRGGYGVSTLPFPDNSYVYNYPVKQNNVFNAPNNFAPAGSMKAGFPDPMFVQIPANGIIDASPAVLRNASYFHVRPDMHEGSLHSFNVAFQRELPARFTLDVAYVGNRGHDVADAVQRERGDRRRSAGEQRPAAVPAVRQVGGRDHLDRDEDRVQLAAGEARSALLRRPPRDVVVHVGARMELRERRQQHASSPRRPTSSGAGRAPIRIACTAWSRASCISCRSGPTGRGCATVP